MSILCFKLIKLIGLVIIGISIISCYDDLEEINTENKQISITGIPSSYNSRMYEIYLSADNPNLNLMEAGIFNGSYNIFKGSVSGNSINASSDWNGFGSFNIILVFPYAVTNAGGYRDTKYEIFRFSNGTYNIKDTKSIISFNSFSKYTPSY